MQWGFSLIYFNNISIKLKGLLAFMLEESRYVGWKFSRVPDNTVIILMYHRILPKGIIRKWVQKGMYVETDTFERHAAYLKEYFRVVSLDSIYEKTSMNMKPEDHRPMCGLTFDDGWRDFATHTFPLLQKYDLPATVFLPTGYVGTEEWFWTDRIAYLFTEREKCMGRGKSLSIPIGERVGRELVRIEKEWFVDDSIEAIIQFLKGIREEEIVSLIERLEDKWGISSVPPERAFLSWEEVRAMAESGSVSFGSHTNRHRILTGLNEEEIREELSVSRKCLLKELPNMTKKVIFCYPNGKYNERIAKLVEETGYSHAVTTENGWNNLATDRFRLKRIGLHQDIARTPAMLACRILQYI